MLRRLSFGLASTALLFLALPNCSDGGGSDGASACGAYYNALISYTNRCSNSSEGFETIANAQGRFEALCAKWSTAPGAAGLPNQVSACTNTLSSAACGDNDDAGCNSITGTLADGSACGEGFQCTSGACSKTDDAPCGKCTARVAIDGKCTGDVSRECVDGATCIRTGASGGTCKAKKTAKAGEECIGTDQPIECEKGTTCFFPTGGVSSTDRPKCRAIAGAGGDCSSSNECTTGLSCVKSKCAQPPGLGADCELGDACGKGLACGTDKKCQTVTRVAAGAECDNQVRRCARGRCRGASFTSDSSTGQGTITPGKCVDPLPDGAACTKDSGGDKEPPPPCDTFAECINNVCTVPDPASCK